LPLKLAAGHYCISARVTIMLFVYPQLPAFIDLLSGVYK
jgi:hypothetical protein